MGCAEWEMRPWIGVGNVGERAFLLAELLLFRMSPVCARLLDGLGLRVSLLHRLCKRVASCVFRRDRLVYPKSVIRLHGRFGLKKRYSSAM